jgi:glutaredoxin
MSREGNIYDSGPINSGRKGEDRDLYASNYDRIFNRDARSHKPRELVLLTRAEGCPNCASVKSVFIQTGLTVRTLDVDDKENPEVAALLAAKKFSALPLLYKDGENVAGGLSCIAEARRK